MKAKLFTFVRGLKNGTPPRFQSYLKSLTLLLVMLLSVNVWGTDVTFDVGTDDTSEAKDGVTISMSVTKNTSDKYYQVYSGSSMVVTSSSGNIIKIVVTCTGQNNNNYSPSKFNNPNIGSYSSSGYTGTWTGNAQSVTFGTNAQVRMKKIEVTIEGGNQIKITANSISGFAGSYSERTWTANDVSGKCYAYLAGSSEPYLMQFNSTPYIYNTVAVPGYIKSIKIVKGGTMDDRSWSVYCSTSQISESNGKVGGTQIGTAQTVGTAGYTWNVDTENKYTYFYIKKGSSATQISEFVITYEDAPSKTLSSIDVTTQPSKKNYTTCETLDLSGCVVKATYSDNSIETVTSQCTFTPANGATLTTNVTSVAVSFGDKNTSITGISVTEGASDTYVDNVHSSVISGDFSCSYSAPPILDKQKGATESCEDTHYHFVGWVEEGTTPIQSPSNVIPAGTAMTGSNKTYKAVWAKEAE